MIRSFRSTSFAALIFACLGTACSLGGTSTSPRPGNKTVNCDCPLDSPNVTVQACSQSACLSACQVPPGAPGGNFVAGTLACPDSTAAPTTPPAGTSAPLTVVPRDSQLIVIDQAVSTVRLTSSGVQSPPIAVSGVANVSLRRVGEISQFIKIGRIELVAKDFTFFGKTVKAGHMINGGVLDTEIRQGLFAVPRAQLRSVFSGLVDGVAQGSAFEADRDLPGTFDSGTGQFRFTGTLARGTDSVTFDVRGQAQPTTTDTDHDGVPNVVDNCPSVANATQVRVAAPAITAPAPVTINSCGSTVAIGQATAIDTCGTGFVSITNDAPSSFLPGQTVVTWTANDGAGNTRTATQLVTIIGDTSCCPAGMNRIVGTPNNDNLTGTSGNDCILGLGGQDIIHGGGGADFIIGGEGDDQLFGDAGNDTLTGGAGQDRLDGGDGNDALLGADGDDLCWGGPGNDDLRGGQGQDMLSGDGGDDQLNGETGHDTLVGGSGSDICTLSGEPDSASACETIR